MASAIETASNPAPATSACQPAGAEPLGRSGSRALSANTPIASNPAIIGTFASPNRQQPKLQGGPAPIGAAALAGP
jgi:hypothetical protein